MAKHVKEEKLKNSGRKREEPSYPKRTKGSFRCMVSIDRSTHPHFFIRRAGCHAGVGFPGRCQLLLHTVGVPLSGESHVCGHFGVKMSKNSESK